MSTPTIIAESTPHLLKLVRETMLTNGPKCDLNHIDVSGINKMTRLFTQCPKFNGDISQWDVSRVLIFDEMFRDCAFQGDLSQWNVSSATSMRRMFQNTPFDGDISQWDVSRVLNFDEMFRDCAFQGDLSQWNVSSAISMRRMFQNTTFNGDVSKWNVSVLVDAAFMFDHGRFGGDVSAWRPINLKDADHMFHCSRFNGDVSTWNLPNLRNATAMFDKTPFNGDLSSWHLPKVEASYATRLVPGAYTGVLPHIGGDFKDRREFYRRMFKARRGSAGLTAYLEDSPFNTIHLDFSLHTPLPPPSMSPEDMEWVANVKAAGLALGLDEDALWAYAFASFKDRGREMVVEGVDFSMMAAD